MFRYCCLVLLAAAWSVLVAAIQEPEGGFGYKYSQRQGRREHSEGDNAPLVENGYVSRQSNQKETHRDINALSLNIYRAQASQQNDGGDINEESAAKIRINEQEESEDDVEEEDNNENIPYQVKSPKESLSEFNGPFINFNHQEQQAKKTEYEFKPENPILNEGVKADSRKFEIRANYPASSEPEERVTNSGSSYTTMVTHGDPEQQTSALVPQFKTLRGRPTKVYAKPNRPPFGDSQRNYTPLRSIQPEDPPPHQVQQLSVMPTPEDPFVHSVHPSIMKSLLKQQPQTFDVPQKDSEDFDNPTNWNVQTDNKPTNIDHNYNPYKSGSIGHQDTINNPRNVDINKSPIYVPNRVSIHNPSSDSSFNVGYSIGFGANGQSQHPKMGIVQPPVNLRQGKEINYPTSYQNTPINVHFDGKDSIWKNMGNGVEMSQNTDTNGKVYNDAASLNYQNEHSSGSVINQPLFHRETFDEKYSFPSSGRNSFDHNHALQQSNTFDFSNAIDPNTNLRYSKEQKSTYFSNPTHTDTFLKQIPSFESPQKQHQTLFSELSSKNVRPLVESSQYLNSNHLGTPHQSQSIVTTGGRVVYEGIPHDGTSHSESLSSPVKNSNYISLNHKAKAIDSIKSNVKPNYTFKQFGSISPNHFGEEYYSHNSGFPDMHVVPPIYAPAGKPPPGMVQAILVPVNTPGQSFPYPLAMPVMGHGYPQYFGHPIGVIRMPEHIASPYKSGYEHSDGMASTSSDPQQYTPLYQKPSPSMKVVHSHYAAVKHQKEQPSESSFYHLQKSPHSPHRDEEVPDRRPPLKYKRLHATESPAHAHPVIKTLTTQSSSHNPQDLTEATTPYSHHLRPYRKGSMIIVKRA